MIGTGKYNFPGIRKAGIAAINAILAGTTWGAWLIASPFLPLLDYAEGWLVEYLANKGLLIINLGIFYVEGKIDQSRFDSAFDEALKAIQYPGLTDEQKVQSTKKLSMLLKSLVPLTVIISGCQTFRTSDYPLIIRLPASRECYEFKVMSHAEKRYPEKECDEIISRAIFITSETWRLMRGDIQANCQNAKCEQVRGAADGLFITVDEALQKVPIP
jgi:hypothetical protein